MKIISFVTGFLSLGMFFSCFSEKNLDMLLFGIIVGIIFTMLTVMFSMTCIRYQNIIKHFNNGEFVVLDGWGNKAYNNGDTVNSLKVEFITYNNENAGFFGISGTNYNKHQHLLLVKPTFKTKHMTAIKVLTPYMLTPEGRKKPFKN